MSGFSNYLADRIIAEDLDGSFIALFNGDPTDTGASGDEVTTDIAAARLPISLGAPTGTGTRSAANDAEVDFGAAVGAASVTHFALFDAATAGNMLASAALAAPQTVAATNPVKFAVGALTVSVT